MPASLPDVDGFCCMFRPFLPYVTRPQTDMAPESRPSQKEMKNQFLTLHFQAFTMNIYIYMYENQPIM